MDKHLSYWQEHLNVDQFRDWHKNLPYNINNLIDLLAEQQTQSVLDCGAGVGNFYKALKLKNVNLDYQGIEITPKFIEAAQNDQIPMILADIENIPCGDNSYDVCVAFSVLNHLYDYRPALIEMLRVAKKQVIVTFFKPSVERLNYLPAEIRKFTIGWYPGKWDSSNMPVTCPKLGFYPGRWNHDPLILLKKNYKIYNSPFGFYTHYHEDNSGQPTCIHHYFEMSKFFSFIKNLSNKSNDTYTVSYGGDSNTLKSYHSWTKEPNTPHMKYYANVIHITKSGVKNG